MLRIGIDTGGTFTDFVVVEDGEFSVFKVPSTPKRPAEAILLGLGKIKGEHALIQHGTTVGTNALLERKGAKTLVLTNQGFEDILEIGRQNRPGLYKLGPSRPQSLVEAKNRIGVKQRTSWNGHEIVTLEQKSLDWLRGKVDQLDPEVIAVALLYSYLNPTPELRIAEALKSTGKPVSLSHEILPEFREFERMSATVINAYLTPVVSSYLRELTEDPGFSGKKLTLMQSNGGTISADRAVKEPVRTLLSGPAAGVVGAFEVAKRAGLEQVITFDMGGTSTDVCLCDGRIKTTREATIGGLPVPIQMIDIISVGAGGGSVASVDEGGVLKVGPESAGADPGPACYGTGERVTVTDANLYLGLLDADWFLGGEFELHPHRSEEGLQRLASEMNSTHPETEWSPQTVARGIRSIVGAHMERAIRVASLEKGFDTRDFTLVSYGGAGGLHVCDLARALLIPRIIVPRHPGVVSALGTVQSDVVRDASLTVLGNSEEEEIGKQLEEGFAQLRKKVLEELGEEGFDEGQAHLENSLDVRYPGQSFELNVPGDENYRDSFHEAHRRQYGYANSDLPVEVVTLRVTGRGRFPQIHFPKQEASSSSSPAQALLQEKQIQLEEEIRPVSFYIRKKLLPGNLIQGPAIILEYSSTLLLPRDFEARVDSWFNLVVEPRNE